MAASVQRSCKDTLVEGAILGVTTIEVLVLRFTFKIDSLDVTVRLLD